MYTQPLQRALLVLLLLGTAAAQVLTVPGSTNRFTSNSAMDAVQSTQMDFSIFKINTTNPNSTPLESPSGSVSKLDLKAPAKARREYQKGYLLLMRNDLQAAIQHLANSIAIYPNFVAAHNALGTVYLNLSHNQHALDEFTEAVSLDDHLPNSYLNLGLAQLALKLYPAAEGSLRKASSIAPLDVQLALALAYGEFMNRNYQAVVTTAQYVHNRQHKGAEIVHYFAAGAWEALDNLTEAQHEMETLLNENPQSSLTGQFHHVLAEIKNEQTIRTQAKFPSSKTSTFFSDAPSAMTREEAARQAQQALQDVKERSQIAQAEAEPDPICASCPTRVAGNSHKSGLGQGGPSGGELTLRAFVDEVDILFSATDHGKSVMDLHAPDIGIRDNSEPPQRILGFRNESQLPLRLGLVIDTSNSVLDRFSFELGAATKFLQAVVTDTRDLAFVVGINNSVLLVQDFTPDKTLLCHAMNQLAPGGGTALWDAAKFAAEKLAVRPEVQPVARVLVVISDGKDNSSGASLKAAITEAARGEVVVYTVSTRDLMDDTPSSLLGTHALRTLSELTGGAAFVPGSLRRLNGSLDEVQQAIHGRYLLSYHPASFQRDGRYRRIELTAQRDGHQFKVFARRGYYASSLQPKSDER